MEDYYESHDNIQFDSTEKVPAACYIDYKMTYEGKLINECPFCKAHIETEISKSHWLGIWQSPWSVISVFIAQVGEHPIITVECHSTRQPDLKWVLSGNF